jgi:hypothetical protein
MIAFAGKERFCFQVGDVNVRGAKFALQLFQEVFALLGIRFFLGKVDVRLEVAAHRRKLFVRSDLLFCALAVTENALSGFLIAPEIGVSDAGFECLQAFAVGFGVKDSSGRA